MPLWVPRILWLLRMGWCTRLLRFILEQEVKHVPHCEQEFTSTDDTIKLWPVMMDEIPQLRAGPVQRHVHLSMEAL